LPFPTYAGLAIKPDGTPYKFAQLWPTIACPWRGPAAQQTISYVERAGGEILTYDANQDASIMLTQYEDAFAAGVDGILCNPAGLYELYDVSKRLWLENGIPTVVVDIKIYESEFVASPYVLCAPVHSQLEHGRNCGRYMLEYFQDKGEKGVILEVWGAIWHSGAILRHEGFHEIVDEYPDIIEVHESAPCDWRTALAMSAVEDGFYAWPDINGVFSHSDVMMDGVIEGLRVSNHLFKVGEPGHVCLTGVDAGPLGFKYIGEGYQDASAENSSFKETDASLKLLMIYCCLGLDVSDYWDTFVPGCVMTKDNYDEGAFKVTYIDHPGEYDYWPVFDFIVPTPTRLDPKVVLPNPIPGEEEMMQQPRLATPYGYYSDPD